MKQTLLLFLFLLFSHYIIAQETGIDSSRILPEALVTAFGKGRGTVSGGSIVRVIQMSDADRYNKSSLVHGFNAVAGVRMEERSPGSYRLNIRGSSLRSPFGVRNVKVYWNNIPITDPGGNTYFNQFAFNNFSHIEIFKGPAGSMYGAGTGGLVLMHSFGQPWKAGADVEYITGSYGLQNVFTSFRWGQKENKNTLSYSHNESDGYRNHTNMRRDNFSWSTQLSLSDKQKLEGHLLYNNMYYQTPGGLTLAEFNNNPRQARPAAGAFPSAQNAKAAIEQKNLVAGITHQYQFSKTFSHTTSLYGAFSQIKNPTFRNYERRNEPHFGGRSQFEFGKEWNMNKILLIAGGELQQGYFNTQVSKNKNGNPDTLQTNDDINYTTYSIFAQADWEFNTNWIVTAGVSINKSSVRFSRLNRYPVISQKRTYQNELSPRISLLKKISADITVFASVAKGFSPPTIAELLPSTGVISTFLEAEQGINYEFGGRLKLFKGKLQLEATAFYFKLNNALVVRKDSANADYYVNAGDTRQKGLEISIDYFHSFRNSSLFDHLSVRTAQSIYDFSYGNFQKDAINYSGKKLPSVPGFTGSLLADLQLRKGAYINSTYYHASRIWLNDANTVETKAYDLLGARIGWKFRVSKTIRLNIYAGADNLLDEVYSLGNDINAAAGRYYNVAPARNYYAGVGLGLQ
jgi:iron complex outermembrane receptor protein